ncbi:hypothetical protein ACHAXA_006179 [Cyclostephanos tholiformis]|uniref:Uncharacterized protein n=1 Tax=Cyclostephanos tholiformis TaxID=382380 RepID=A0ABD3R5Y3_9STRA
MADGEDAVHYGGNTTSMEVTHFANLLCRDDGFAQRQRHHYGCQGDDPFVVDLDGMITKEEALPCVR